MGIRTSVVDVQDGVDCDLIHMTELCLMQPMVYTESAPMMVDLSIGYRKYGVTGDDRTVITDPRSVFVTDYVAMAEQKANAGDPTLLNAITAIEQAVAVIIQELGSEGTTEVVV